jgi:hypothetical protein
LETLEDRCVPSFSNPITTTVHYHPATLVAADVNGDGKSDLITIGGGDIQVLLGKGNGKFGFAFSASPGGTDSTTALAVADINGDGKPDIITANEPGDGGVFGETPSISVFLGNGNGTFQSAQTSYVPAGDVFYSLAVGDFNGDGRTDIVATAYNTVTVMLNSYISGGGYFNNAQTYTFSPSALPAFSAAAVGDFNDDGKPDIAAIGSDGTVNVLLNKGDGTGTFLAAQPYAVGGTPTALAVGDFNGDGKPDLAVTTVTPSGTTSTYGVSVLLNTGNGTFGTARSYAVGGGAFVAVGDFNQDGKLDIVTTGAEMDVLLNNGAGTFGPAQKVGPAGSAVVVADFNGDGFPDLAQIDGSGASIDVLLNKADWQKGH